MGLPGEVTIKTKYIRSTHTEDNNLTVIPKTRVLAVQSYGKLLEKDIFQMTFPLLLMERDSTTSKY